MVRGRVQVEWRCTDQTRANTQRDWLSLQLQGRGFISDALPRAIFSVQRNAWVTVCDAAFTTVTEGDTVKTLCLSRQAADPLILAGSWTQIHTCSHEDGLNNCASTLVRTVK